MNQKTLISIDNTKNMITNLTLSTRQLCDIELILDGSFSPINGFMTKKDYDSVLSKMRLSSGEVWPIPITLDVDNDFIVKNSISTSSKISLRDKEGFEIATMDVEDIWEPNFDLECSSVYGTVDTLHPGVDFLKTKTKQIYLGGKLERVSSPKHYDFNDLRFSPKDLKSMMKQNGWDKLVAFQTRNPMHKAHKEIAFSAAKSIGAKLLIHPVVGLTKPGDVDHFVRVRCYQHILKRFPDNTAMLSLLPLAMRMAGPREALWHAIIRKNYGCTHFIVGRDHAGPGLDSNGKPFYGPYDAQEMVTKYQDEIGIKMVPFKHMVFVKNEMKFMESDSLQKDAEVLNVSGTELRHRLENSLDIPEWFTYPEIVNELRKFFPLKENQGFTLFFTGLSGSGKSTIANGLMIKLMEHGKRRVTLLDGDVVRTHLSSELGFSKEHRDINVKRIGYVASEITKNGGIAICAPIAPYHSSRNFNRSLISNVGHYVEIFISTPLDVCEERDTKGLYALARAGKIKEFTGIDDPYEAPENAEINLDTSSISPEDAVNQIFNYLLEKGFVV